MSKRTKQTPDEQLAEASAIYRQWAEEIQKRVATGASVVDAIMSTPPVTAVIDNYIQALYSVDVESKAEILRKTRADPKNSESLLKDFSRSPYVWQPSE